MSRIDQELKDILSKYHPDPEKAVWNCRGKWVAYHKAIEVMEAKAGITFDHPVIIESNAEKGIAVVCVTGHMGDRSIWSFGEASPKNNKNEYCFSMAEKRGIDRVVLKLIGLHGEIYSEDEADDFKNSAPSNHVDDEIVEQEDSQELCKSLLAAMNKITTAAGLQTWGKTNADMIASLREADQRTIRKEFTARKSQLTLQAA